MSVSRTIRFESEEAAAAAIASVATGIDAERVGSTVRLSADSVDALEAAAAALADAERAAAAGSLGAGDATVEDRAATAFGAVSSGPARLDDLQLAVRCIDLTTLEGDDTPGRVRWLCAQAIQPDPLDPTVGPTAAVCVYPAFVPLARTLTEGSGVKVASVAGAFPSGHSSLDVRLTDIRHARDAGAHEIDIVLNRTAFLIGDHDVAAHEIRASKQAAVDAHLKVIIEVGELGSDAAIRAATQLVIDAGADVVKTSTGKTAINATPAAVLAMAEVIAAHRGDPVGLKVAGGVRTPDDALGYLAIVRRTLGDDWLTPNRFRFGASGLLGNLVAALR